MGEQTQTRVMRVPDGKIVDYIDESLRNDTPEEYVRQTVEKRLVNEHGYSHEQIKIEFGLKMGSRRPRADIVVFPDNSPELTQDYVQTIIECKNEKIDPKSKDDGVEQLKSYMSACPNCEWGMWTNGKHKDVLRKVLVEGRYEFHEYNDIPPVDGNLEDVDRPKRENLKRGFEDNLLMAFKTCHNHIYITDGMQKQPAFFELLKLIFCKTLDERSIERSLEFYATSGERSDLDGQLTVRNRISKIFEQVKRQYPQIFESNDEIMLEPRSLARIVAELQPYSLLETHVDVKGKAYEELVGANLRGDRGEFFTPRNVMRMAVKMVDPKPSELVCDPSCGTGGFLVMAMNHVRDQLIEELERDWQRPQSQWTEHENSMVTSRIGEIAASNFFGFDINPDLVKATKMNMVMNNDGSGNISRNNSLLHPHEWSSELKANLTHALNISPDSIRNHNTIEFFDVIVTNPPFGSKITIKDGDILGQFEIGGSSSPPERLFIERNLQFLKPGGRMAIVLPDSILSNPGLEYLREWLIKKTRIIASVDLHVDTFQPRNGTQTSILIVQKKTQEEIRTETSMGALRPYNIFMAVLDKIGHDKRGNTLYKRDEEGYEIWEPENPKTLEIDSTAAGRTTYRPQGRTRVRDDQCVEVPPVFAQWKQEEGIQW